LTQIQKNDFEKLKKSGLINENYTIYETDENGEVVEINIFKNYQIVNKKKKSSQKQYFVVDALFESLKKI